FGHGKHRKQEQGRQQPGPQRTAGRPPASCRKAAFDRRNGHCGRAGRKIGRSEARLSQATERKTHHVMSLNALGINHRRAPVALRERVAFAGEALPRALTELRALPQVREAALLSTCNRTELYAVTADDGAGLADWLATHPEDSGDLHAYLYRHRDA